MAFQLIGDVANGNRLSGTPGYDASALYVAAAARLAGHSVYFQDFDYELDFLADWKASILAVTSRDRRALVPGIAGALFGGDFGSMYGSPSGDQRNRQIFAADLTLPPPATPTGDSGLRARRLHRNGAGRDRPAPARHLRAHPGGPER